MSHDPAVLVAMDTQQDLFGTRLEAELGMPLSRSSDTPCLTHRDRWARGTTHGRRWDGDRAEELERVVRVLTELFDVSELALRVAESALPLFRAQFSINWLRQLDGSLACAALAGPGLESLKIGDVLPDDAAVVGRAAADGQAVWAADVLGIAGGVRTGEAGHDGRRAVLAVPLIVKGEVIGAIVTGYGKPRDLAQAEIDLVQTFADRIAPAMRNVQLFAHAQAARAAAEAASQAKDEFLALLAHELRNSLAPIVTSAELIRRAAAPGAVAQDGADIVTRHARHLARLLDDLLDVSRIARGTLELKREPVSLAAAVQEVVEATRPLADLVGLTVSLSLPLVPLWVEADPTRLEQIVVNILNNAVKYTPAGGRIEVTAAAEAGEAVLRVHDTGIGIVAEMLPHVFDFFVRSDGARVHTPDGLGVGLTLTRQLVELQGGHVAAHSEGPGLGSEFTVRFPLGPGAEPPAPAAASARGPAYGVLVIEDNRDARETLRALLEYEGHRVEVTGDGPTGLARDEATRPDVVLIDIGLPGLNGYEVATRIRARRAAEPLLVAITGYGSVEDRRRSLEAGFDAHLTKPVLSNDLMDVLGILGHRPLTRRGQQS